MYVVDYLRKTVSNAVTVPPFHTGPIGLLPDTEVCVSLMEGVAGLEVVFRPYQMRRDNLLHVACTMRDQPGVVGRLIEAVSETGANIVNQVSTAIDHLDHHPVDLILDWTPSRFPDRTPSSASQQRHYREFHSLFPTEVHRYVVLFESIVEHCGDVLLASESNGVSIPQITMREIQSPANLDPYGQVVVSRANSKGLHVEIPLPPALVARLRLKLRIANGEDLPYILLSETETRTLRAFFPRQELLSRLLHVGFYHIDTPGALAALLRPLAAAGFNILTSLLRQNKDGRNVWEAVLENRTNKDVPAFGETSQHSGGEELCLWIAKEVLASAAEADEEKLKECDLQVGLPRYPPRRWAGRICLADLIASSPRTVTVPVADETKPSQRKRSSLVELVRTGREKVKGSIFLSYPKSARSHAGLIKRRLERRYNVVDYQEPDSEIIVEQVLHKIEHCDYFIGIWHPEDDGKSLSPWMHFEYGTALALGKKAMILHREGIDPRVWKRINPGIAQPEYSDLRFDAETLPMIERYCEEHFPTSEADDPPLSKIVEAKG